MWHQIIKHSVVWVVRGILGLGLALLFILATFGFWVDQAIRWQGERFGFTVGEVRGGWGWFSLHDAQWTSVTTRLNLDVLRAPTPLAILTHWTLRGETPVITGGVLTVHPLPNPEPERASPVALTPVLTEVGRWFEYLSEWGISLELDSLRWNEDTALPLLSWDDLRFAEGMLTANWLPPENRWEFLSAKINLTARAGQRFLHLQASDPNGKEARLFLTVHPAYVSWAGEGQAGGFLGNTQGQYSDAGDLRLSSLRVTHPVGSLTLREPWQVWPDSEPSGQTGGTSFDLELDLAAFQQAGLRGTLNGEFGWDASPWKPWPALRGNLRAMDLVIGTVSLPAAAARWETGPDQITTGRVAAREIELSAPNGGLGEKFQRLQQPAFLFSISPAGVNISGGSVGFREGQIFFEGGLPLPPATWPSSLGSNWERWWEVAHLRVFLDEFELAAVPDLLPGILRPTGSFFGQLIKTSGEKFPQGLLQARDLSLRPLPNFGSIQGIGFRLVSEKGRLRIEEGVGILGRRPVSVAGEVGLTSDLSLADYRLIVTGQRLRLVRQPRFLLHGDVDLLIEGKGSEPGRISGNIQPIRGMLFQSLPSLRPTPSDSRSRPPYFSVTEEPWNNWEIDLTVEGGEFLEIRNPFARFLLSADFQILGTLEEPMAIGTITVDRSLISFPFVRFRSQEGRIESTRGNPFDPEITYSAVGKIYGYDLAIEVNGGISDPVIRFTSSPFLESTEIMQMITTGILPTSSGADRAVRFSTLGLYLGRTFLDGIRTDHLRFAENPSVLERTEIEFGREITESGLDTINVEMPLNSRLSILGEYDRFDTYNVNLGWKIYSR